MEWDKREKDGEQNGKESVWNAGENVGLNGMKEKGIENRME